MIGVAGVAVGAKSYDGSGFETYLSTQLTNAGANTYTVTIDENTFLMTITSTGAFVIRWSVTSARARCILGGTIPDTASLVTHITGAINIDSEQSVEEPADVKKEQMEEKQDVNGKL